MTLEELIAQELYSDVKLEDALKYIETDKQNGKRQYSMNEIVRCVKVACNTKIILPKEEVKKDLFLFKEGETYSTIGGCSEPFLIKEIVKIKKNGVEHVTKFIGVYTKRPHLGLCPINPELLKLNKQ